MPIGIDFSKEKAEYFLDCLAHGKPIEGICTVDNVLALAGACVVAAMSHGPVRLSDEEWLQLPAERRKDGEEQFLADLQAAVTFFAHLTMLVRNRTYDGAFDLDVRVVLHTTDGENQVVPIRGFRNSR